MEKIKMDEQTKADEPSFVNEFIERDPEAEEIFQNLPLERANRDSRLPELTYLFEIRDAAGGWTSEPRRFTAKLMLEVLQPVEYAGRFQPYQYMLGSTEDPRAEGNKSLDAAVNFKADEMYRLMNVCGINHIRDAKGKQFCASVRHNGDYTNLFNYAPAGSVVPGQAVQPRNFTKRGASRSGSQHITTAPTPPAEKECSICHNMFPALDLPFHMAGCTKLEAGSTI